MGASLATAQQPGDTVVTMIEDLKGSIDAQSEAIQDLVRVLKARMD